MPRGRKVVNEEKEIEDKLEMIKAQQGAFDPNGRTKASGSSDPEGRTKASDTSEKKKGRKRLETVVVEPEEQVEEEIKEVKTSDKSDTKEPIKEIVKEPAFDAKGYIDEMFKAFSEKMTKPVVEEPNIVKKKGKKDCEKKKPIEKKSVVKETKQNMKKNVVIEQTNEDMLRAEYEREIRKRMMNSLFDY